MVSIPSPEWDSRGNPFLRDISGSLGDRLWTTKGTLQPVAFFTRSFVIIHLAIRLERDLTQRGKKPWVLFVENFLQKKTQFKLGVACIELRYSCFISSFEGFDSLIFSDFSISSRWTHILSYSHGDLWAMKPTLRLVPLTLETSFHRTVGWGLRQDWFIILSLMNG